MTFSKTLFVVTLLVDKEYVIYFVFKRSITQSVTIIYYLFIIDYSTILDMKF